MYTCTSSENTRQADFLKSILNQYFYIHVYFFPAFVGALQQILACYYHLVDQWNSVKPLAGLWMPLCAPCKVRPFETARGEKLSVSTLDITSRHVLIHAKILCLD